MAEINDLTNLSGLIKETYGSNKISSRTTKMSSKPTGPKTAPKRRKFSIFNKKP
jgi:hypothetical protein